MNRFWRDYNLSIVLAVLFLVSWILQTWMGWVEFVSQQEAHSQAATVFGSDGYIWQWGQSTFENWQSEFLQLLSFVYLTSVFVHRGSHESKDSDEAMQGLLERIDQRLARLEQHGLVSGNSGQVVEAARAAALRGR